MSVPRLDQENICQVYLGSTIMAHHLIVPLFSNQRDYLLQVIKNVPSSFLTKTGKKKSLNLQTVSSRNGMHVSLIAFVLSRISFFCPPRLHLLQAFAKHHPE